MAYRRRYDPDWKSKQGPTRVTIHWSESAGAYAIKWHDTNHWDQMTICRNYIMNFPYGEREYDGDTKTWYLIEKHTAGLKTMIELTPQWFTLDYIEKPIGVQTVKFIPMDVHLDNFKTLTGFDIRNQEYKDAKKVYFRACMKLHPDINQGDATQMTELNVAWAAIEKEHYKQGVKQDYAIQ